MAEFLVPPHGSFIVRCHECKGLYMPQKVIRTYGTNYFERCPFCGSDTNTIKHTIPVWKYNLLRFFRCGAKVEDIEKEYIGFKEEEDKYKTEIKRLKEQINQLQQPQEETSTTEYPPPPNEDDYTYKIKLFRNGNKKTEYRFYGIVDSVKDLPRAKTMPVRNAVYYVEAKQCFVTNDEKFGTWSLMNDINEYITLEQRSLIMNKIRGEGNVAGATSMEAIRNIIVQNDNRGYKKHE